MKVNGFGWTGDQEKFWNRGRTDLQRTPSSLVVFSSKSFVQVVTPPTNPKWKGVLSTVYSSLFFSYSLTFPFFFWQIGPLLCFLIRLVCQVFFSLPFF